MRTCIINSNTGIVENIVHLSELERIQFVPYKENIKIASRHDGEIGWQLDKDTDEWIVPTQTITITPDYIRRVRNKLLRINVDKYNPAWWNTLSPEQQAEITEYRQLLLDITDQPGFPENIVWPHIPEI